ncbi:hypothetical protein BTM25_10060 [Actinomadura rubteroloni]|uniref:DUF2589 domain-containing protein n=1 Tax=Actinomadura rubteroloni TaxID=1926885 RepID=A0A2P4UNH0_9ACTN|nr:DUF2589 domain-containing protein [Actinomadura rubteroloni]POM26604.1 hypothetical protein BTM25_10060 [Actinomadura rubteroloni]
MSESGDAGALASLRVEQLLAAAYQGVVRAQAGAFQEAARVIDGLGFSTDEHGRKVARTLEFDVRRLEFDPELQETAVKNVHVSVPVLSMLTLPNLVVDEADIEMALQITGHDGDAVLRARVAPHQQDANLRIRTRLKQQPSTGAARIGQILDTAVADAREG